MTEDPRKQRDPVDPVDGSPNPFLKPAFRFDVGLCRLGISEPVIVIIYPTDPFPIKVVKKKGHDDVPDS